MSVSMGVTYFLLRFTTRTTATAQSARASALTRQVPAGVSRGIRRIADVENRVVNGRPVTTLTPKQGATGTHLIYTHGGCFLYAMIPAYWAILETLIRDSGVTVTVPHYGLAPDHTADEAYALLDAVYESTGADRVFLAGDSAGGALALGQAMRYRDTGKKAPAGIILFSPLVDSTFSNPAIAALAPKDRQLGREGFAAAAQWFAGDRAVTDPLLSPLLGDLSGLPPVWIYQGGNDILAADAQLLADKLHATKGTANLVFESQGFHDYVGAPWTPEARRALAEVAATLRTPA